MSKSVNSTSDARSKITGALFFLTLVALIWAVVWTMESVWNHWRMWHLAESYRAARFHVEAVYFTPSSSSPRTSYQAPWGKGLVDGRIPEKIALRSFLPREPESIYELEAMIPPLTTLDVLYNPEQEGFLRVVELQNDFAAHQRESFWRAAAMAYAPALIFLLGWMIFNRLAKRNEEVTTAV